MIVRIDFVLRSKSDVEGVHVESESIRLTDPNGVSQAATWRAGKLELPEHQAHGSLLNVDRMRLFGDPGDRSVLNVALALRAAGLRAPSPVTRLRLDASALRSDAPLQGSRHGRQLGSTGEGLPLAVKRLRGTAQWEAVLAGLQSVYPRIEDVDTLQVLPGVVALSFKERSIHEKLGKANVSDGVIHALALLVALNGGSPSSLLAIEEPENAIHPWALRNLLGRAQDAPRRAPLLLTTHSPVVVDAVRDPDSLFIVENTADHGTTVETAISKEAALRAILDESGEGLGQLWLKGMLGGVPEAGE